MSIPGGSSPTSPVCTGCGTVGSASSGPSVGSRGESCEASSIAATVAWMERSAIQGFCHRLPGFRCAASGLHHCRPGLDSYQVSALAAAAAQQCEGAERGRGLESRQVHRVGTGLAVAGGAILSCPADAPPGKATSAASARESTAQSLTGGRQPRPRPSPRCLRHWLRRSCCSGVSTAAMRWRISPGVRPGSVRPSSRIARMASR